MSKKKKYRTNRGSLKKSFTYNGKRYYVYAFTEDELLEKKKRRLEELKQGEEKRTNPTLNKYYEHLTAIRRLELNESTLRAQKSQYNTISKVRLANNTELGDMKIGEIRRADVEYVRAYLLKEGKTPENLNICFGHLNHVFQCAVLEDTIVKNPIKALKKLKRESDTIRETKHRALSIEETRKFLEVAKERKSFYINCFEMMLLTGVRTGELSALAIKDFDTNRNKLHIRKTISRDEIGNYYISKHTKTKTSTRDIPLKEEMLDVMKKQIELNHLVFGPEASDTLFRSSENQLLREYTLNREIKRICKEANIPIFTSHAFRNTFATRFIEQMPGEYKALSEILGHKKVDITLNLYAHVMDENKTKAMEKISVY